MASQTLTANWIEDAASRGATKWLKQFIRHYVLELEKERIGPKAFAAELQQEFESRGLDTPAQQKNYRSNVVQAIKMIDPEHPAIALVALSTEQYRDLNDQQRERIADRETRFITSQDAEVVVERASRLIKGAEWADVGAGLAVLIGRRISEIVLSKFELKTPWSLSFSQMAKKKDTQDITIEIPTLAPAQPILEAIVRLQQGLATNHLQLTSISPREAKQRVNNLYSGAIANKCEAHFSDLVPARTDKDNLYTHIFRALYATIAAHWYCPPSVPEHQFKSEIQGHFTISQEGKKLPNYAARSNYDDYAIGDGNGNRDGRLGIKLGQVQELRVIEAFQKDQDAAADDSRQNRLPVEVEPEVTDEPPQAPQQNKEAPMTNSPAAEQAIKRPQVYADDLELMNRLMAERGMVGATAETFRALLETFVEETSASQQQQVETIGGIAQTLNWFQSEIDTLRQQYGALERENKQLSTQSSKPEALSALQERNGHLENQNAELESELEEVRSQLGAIQKLLGGGAASSNGSSQSAPPRRANRVQTATTTAPSTVATPSDQEADTKRDRTDSEAKIADIVDAIIRWNTAQERSELRLRISFPLVKSLAVLVGAGYQPAIKAVFDEKAAEIDEIHERFMIGSRQNRSVQDKDSVLQAIARDYIGLDNWDEAIYAG